MKRTILLVFIFIASFALTSCYAFFQGKVSMDADGNSSTLGTLVSETETITQLSAPSQIFVSQGLYAGVIKVSWSAVTGASSYRLERAVVTEKTNGSFAAPDDGEYEVVSGGQYVYTTSFTDTILSSPTYSDSELGYGYFYRVSAENPRKNYDSSEYTVSSAGVLLAPPTNVKASLGESSSYVKVTWTASTYASSYKVYRSTNSDGTSASVVGTVTSNQNWFKNTIDSTNQGVEFYYSVYAVNASGNLSAASSLALGYSLVSGAPGQVTNVAVDSGKGRGDTTNSITISWTAVTADASTVYYSVYRTSSTDSSYTLLSGTETGTSYTDTKSLKTNVYYYYQVQAWIYASDNSTKLKGPFSASSATDTTPAEGYILSPPASVAVTKNSDGSTCTVVFSAALGSSSCVDDSKLSSDYNSYSYKIYTCATESGTYEAVLTVDGATAYDYYSAAVKAAAFYKVSTVNVTVESALSSAAAPAPYAVTGVSATKYAKFDSGTYSDGSTYSFTANSSGVYPVKITWTAPEGGAGGGYYVYRSTKTTSGFRKITSTAVTDLYYVDVNDTAKTGTYYYYKVLSLNSLGQGTNYSDVIYGYGALTYDQYFREYNKTVKQSQSKLTYMHKSGNTAKLGEETINGDLTGTLYYDAYVSGVSGRVIMKYTNYADYYTNSDASCGYYFYLNGNTNTSASMDASGTMDGTVTCTGMYPGTVVYDNIKIISGGANGGYYMVTPNGFASGEVSYTVGNE